MSDPAGKRYCVTMEFYANEREGFVTQTWEGRAHDEDSAVDKAEAWLHRAYDRRATRTLVSVRKEVSS